MVPMQKIAVTLREATALSGIGRSSLYKLFKTGELTPRKAGKRTLLIVAELESYVKSLPAGGLSHDA
jgi:predicted DNA-binding transcriptional regulator AlpA